MASQSINDKLLLTNALLRHRIKAKSTAGFGVHSPWVYHFLTNIMGNYGSYYAYSQLQGVHNMMQRYKSKPGQLLKQWGSDAFAFPDFDRHLTKSLTPVSQARLLFRLVNFFQPGVVIELGTSLGLTTAYLALARPQAQIISIDHEEKNIRFAQALHGFLGIRNITLKQGKFTDVLAGLQHEGITADFAYIDGDHHYEATKHLAETLRAANKPAQQIALHDIHWSAGMQQAWQELSSNPNPFNLRFDLFWMGLLLRQPGIPEQFHRIRL